MITEKNKIFHIDTLNTSYVFKVNKFGHLLNLYYGARIAVQDDYSALEEKYGKGFTNIVAYDNSEPEYSLDFQTLEYSGTGKGDMRGAPIEIVMPDKSYVTDFVYKSHRIYGGAAKPEGMPAPEGDAETLELTLADSAVELIMYYTVYYDVNVIARRVKVVNNNSREISVNRIMSLMLDFCDDGYELVSFDGMSIGERGKNTRRLSQGTAVVSSQTGFSSNKSNPLIILKKEGRCYGFNLIYSGNHYESAEVSCFCKTRIMTGINPHCFHAKLAQGMCFDTPYAVMTFAKDENALSRNFHKFVNNNIVRGEYKNKPRPVLLNNWEATYFDFNEAKLLKLAKTAAKTGVELFVLDDGWFGKRDDDTSGLGDWTPNIKKTGGLKSLAEKINKTGMKFGLWVEPEMVNPDSDLYRAHPEYAVRLPGRKPSLARNQYILDFTRKDVRDYIVNSIDKLIKSANIEYIKWDMNRHMSDMYTCTLENMPDMGLFYHNYILGLYDVMERITSNNACVLFESCASGGNRFDLGMLCYMPQIWTSDNTDPSERVRIQGGTSYGYPLSTMGAHVSAAPHHQTLRTTPLLTRFNVACFGIFGFELDLDTLTSAELKEAARQVEFYKKYREVLQYGDFTRLAENGRVIWQVDDGKGEIAIILDYQERTVPNPPIDIIKPVNLNPGDKYKVRVFEQRMSIRQFGSLINHALPVKIKTDGLIYNTIDNHLMLKIEDYEVSGTGDMLMNAGFKLKHQFNGSGYDESVRVLTDCGSRLYIIERIK